MYSARLLRFLRIGLLLDFFGVNRLAVGVYRDTVRANPVPADEGSASESLILQSGLGQPSECCQCRCLGFSAAGTAWFRPASA